MRFFETHSTYIFLKQDHFLMLKHNVEPGKINPGKPWNSLVNCSELVIIYWIVPSLSMYRVFHRKFIMWVLFAGYNGGTNCVRYDAGSWSESHNLTKSRIGHIMWKSSQADIKLVSDLFRCFRHELCVVGGVVMVLGLNYVRLSFSSFFGPFRHPNWPK